MKSHRTVKTTRLPQVWGLKLKSKPLHSHLEAVTVQPLFKEKLCMAVGFVLPGNCDMSDTSFSLFEPKFVHLLPSSPGPTLPGTLDCAACHQV